ncbi:hypothetical protein Bhyg_14932 [Pseudolycoriella hygida]|uniref:Uncharacterized protein n=1 Tax=Pseudolycoriella hygida TaxID=35572 RepID=A0A9Q0MSM4_9DIPT|nr:hypothetical protein Bhyg_14932 [Pseudolycoriella hygida]
MSVCVVRSYFYNVLLTNIFVNQTPFEFIQLHPFALSYCPGESYFSISFPCSYDEVKMKRRTLAGCCGVGVFVVALVTVCVAFATPSWLVSDYRITGAKLDRIGLWTHCFRSLPDVNDDYQRRFFVGCRWVYDPFTKGYDEIRGFLIPGTFVMCDLLDLGFMIATQFFYTLCLIGMVVSLCLVLLFFLCAGPDQRHFVLLIKLIGYILLATGVCGSIGVIVFACLGNRDKWMPDHANNFFGT